MAMAELSCTISRVNLPSSFQRSHGPHSDLVAFPRELAVGGAKRCSRRRELCRASALLELVPAHVSKKNLNYELLRFDAVKRKAVDLLVVGAGPAGLAVAQRVSKAGVSVCVVDPAPQSVWPNNYGVWVDEFEALDLLDCLDYTWASAVVYLDDEKEKTLERPYGRVNRTRLKSKMLEACVTNGVQFHQAKVRVTISQQLVTEFALNNLISWSDVGMVFGARDFLRLHTISGLCLQTPVHGIMHKILAYSLKERGQHTQFLMTLRVKDVDHNPSKSFVTCEDGTLIEAAVVLDATGHSRRLVKYDKPFNPGYQIAYGIVAEVDSHPFDVNKMLFMDWRDSHLQGNKELQQGNLKLPTFLYAMPFSANHIFLEETSLVARPGVPMDVIQKRMELRLKHLGIHVRSIEEDERCIIPMGGVLPVIPQRVLGIGGTAGMVHPSTGYMVARTLAAAPTLAESVLQKLGVSASNHIPSRPQNPTNVVSSTPSPGNETSSVEDGSGPIGDDLAAGVWADLWPLERQQQRAFFCFGMEVLVKLDLAGTRRFFDAFFDLEPRLWQGFLSSRLYIMELIGFGLSLFKHATNHARAEIVAIGTVPLARLILEMTQMKPPKGQS